MKYLCANIKEFKNFVSEAFPDTDPLELMSTPQNSPGRLIKRGEEDSKRCVGLHPDVNDPNKLCHLTISGSKIDDCGRFTIPEMLNRDTVFQTLFKG